MAASGALHEERRLEVLDGLRGVAVLLVLWFHVWEISWLPAPWPWLQFLPETGFVGVHLFFFLSGFVIVYPFVRGAFGSGAMPTWGSFAWRRFVKIVPSYVLSIAVAYALGYAQTQSDTDAAGAILTHLAFVHTWFPQYYGTINGVLWTLAVEVEFYCLFPLIWWCFRRRPYVTTAAMIALAWAWRAWFAHCCYAGLFAEYEENLPGYLDIFACGMLCAYLYTRYGASLRASRLRLAGPLLALAGIVALVELLQNLFAFRVADQWSGVWQIDKRPLLGAGFFAVAFGSLIAPRWWQILLANPPLQFLATISYNLYLYHQIVARELLAWHLPPYLGGDPHYDFAWQQRYSAVASLAAIGLATIVTYAFERPLLHLRPPRLRGADSGHLRRHEPDRSRRGDRDRRDRHRSHPRGGR
ncbi:MAG TPA: acyltransferase [Verrucomicrobiae bacterium]|nr:acyltransferase [Verrucomicrobiae bacterium]